MAVRLTCLLALICVGLALASTERLETVSRVDSAELDFSKSTAELTKDWHGKADDEKMKLMRTHNQIKKLPPGPMRMRLVEKFKMDANRIGIANAKQAVKNLVNGGQQAAAMRFAFRGFISKNLEGAKKLCDVCGSGKPCQRDPTYGDTVVFPVPAGRLASMGTRAKCARSDSRHYKTDWPLTSTGSYVTTNTARVNHLVKWESNRFEGIAPNCGETIFYRCDHALITIVERAKCGSRSCTATCPANELHTDEFHCLTGSTWRPATSSCSGDALLFRIHGKARDPCTPPGTPYINWDGWGALVKKSSTAWVNMVVDDFPWFEVNGYSKQSASSSWRADHIARLDPEPGKGLFSLYGGANRALAGSKVIA